LDDITLLRKYVADNSEEAFATLVTRHINKVYSVALRHTRNPDQAEEITQAVFVILARKSASLATGWRPRLVAATSLSGWLHQTARLAAVTFIRSAVRRTRREQEAPMESVLNKADTDVWEQIAPLLDAAMARLNETDRHVVVLRFFDGKSMGEIGAALGSNEDAAKKRVGRALDKLQKYFSRRGVHSTTDTIAQAITTNSVQSAPALLIQTTTAVALAKGAAASISTLTLAKATLVAMKTKTIVATATATAAALILGSGGYFVYHLAAARAPSAPVKFADSVPIKFANAYFRPDGDRDGSFLVEVDPGTLRTTNSAPAIHIKGPIAPDSSSAAQNPVAANGAYKKTDNSSSTRYFVTSSSVLYGKHIRITGWLKAKDVRGWGSAFVIILGISGRHLQYDDMSNRPIRGTTDWQQIEIVTDLPDEMCIIYFGPDLYGPGELWGDDFQIDLAPAGAPSTDDRNWRMTGESDPTVYSETTDNNVTHNGHPTVCITYTPNGIAPRGTHTRWAHDFYGSDSDKYSGHTVRMSGWVKTENVSERIEPVLFPYAGWYKLLAQHSMVNDYSLKGTRDWTRFSVTCVIPKDTDYLHTGFNFFGSGKVWIDMDSLKLEIIK
jgi:RNA polymerase sigma factor (sigma-70 family)